MKSIRLRSSKFIADKQAEKLFPGITKFMRKAKVLWHDGCREINKGIFNPMYGTKRPQYVKDAISKANKGRKHSDEVNKSKGQPGKMNPMYGVRRMGSNNPNYKGGIYKDIPAYLRAWRLAKKDK